MLALDYVDILMFIILTMSFAPIKLANEYPSIYHMVY